MGLSHKSRLLDSATVNDPLTGLSSRWPEQTRFLGQVFNDTAASYKFYWLLGLLSVIQRGSQSVFAPTEIVKEMIVAAWHPVCFFRLSLGRQDKLQDLILSLKSTAGLENDAQPHRIRPALEDVLPQIRDLTNLVPTRFLSPWFTIQLRAIDGHERTKRIQELSCLSQESAVPSPYFFVRDRREWMIHLNDAWLAFFHENFEIVRSFAFFHLCKYLQARNPNVPGIVNKLTVPGARDLSAARKFWRLVRIESERTGKTHLFHDIYTGLPLDDQFSIDHFLPWSFVAHDLLWNLAPVSKVTNSMKNDSLPDLQRYLPKLCQLHRESIVSMSNRPQLLEDYFNWFQTDVTGILALSEPQFMQRFLETFEPQLQIAANQGFQASWFYRT